MDITPLVSFDSQIIQSYGSGLFKISGVSYDTPVIVFPDHVESWNFTGNVDDFNVTNFEDILRHEGTIDVVLLGCGAKMQFIKPFIRQAFTDKNMMLEPMDTGAACRTYNVLMPEGRRVAAMLLPV